MDTVTPTNTVTYIGIPERDRTISLGLASEMLTRIAEITGGAELSQAIGYLASWNLAHPYCEIIGGIYDGTPEIVATYRKEQRGPITYQIGAVWHGDHFGFHS